MYVLHVLHVHPDRKGGFRSRHVDRPAMMVKKLHVLYSCVPRAVTKTTRASVQSRHVDRPAMVVKKLLLLCCGAPRAVTKTTRASVQSRHVDRPAMVVKKLLRLVDRRGFGDQIPVFVYYLFSIPA